MSKRPSNEHPIQGYFAKAIHDSLTDQLGLEPDDHVEAYLTEMLVNFLHGDRIYAIRDAEGRRVETVAEMLLEGDIRLNADSFEREREVHRHIGDFLLFWSGLFPEQLRQLRFRDFKDAFVDPTAQGQESYHVVSTFDYVPHDQEAPTFRKLSRNFEQYQLGLRMMRASFEGFALQGWEDGFSA